MLQKHTQNQPARNKQILSNTSLHHNTYNKHEQDGWHYQKDTSNSLRIQPTLCKSSMFCAPRTFAELILPGEILLLLVLVLELLVRM